MAKAGPQKTFNVHDAKSNLSKLIDRAHAGEEIVLVKGGAPWAKLVPIAPPAKRKRVPGGWPELASIPESTWLEPLREEELAYIDDRLTAEHAMRGGYLVGVHRDPFDRLLAGQALAEDMTILTNDAELSRFGCRTLW